MSVCHAGPGVYPFCTWRWETSSLKARCGVAGTHEKRNRSGLMLGIIIETRITVDTGGQGLGVNALASTLFVSGHSTLDVGAYLTERRNVAGEGKHRVVREGRTSNQKEAASTGLGRERHRAWPWVRDQVCRNPRGCTLKGGSGGWGGLWTWLERGESSKHLL